MSVRESFERVMRISVVAGGLDESTWRLQPWRYLWEAANELAARGHEVEILSEHASGLSGRVVGLQCVDVASVRPAGYSRDPVAHLRASRPDVILWNVGATSTILLQPPRLAGTRNVAVFTSPLYAASELRRVVTMILREPRSHIVHVAGAMVSPGTIARYLRTTYDRVIFPSRSLGTTLVQAGLSSEVVDIVPPGRDSDIQLTNRPTRAVDTQLTFLFAGSPAPIRGADLLLRAFAMLGPAGLQARLVILSRHERSKLARQTAGLRLLARRLDLDSRVDLVEGVLPRRVFLDYLSRSDVVVLPFRLVPSVAPLAVLEAAGAGKPLIASAFSSIADLAAPGSLLVRPGDVRALARAIARLAADPAEREAMAGAADRWYASWPTWSEVGGRIQDAICTVAVAREGVQ